MRTAQELTEAVKQSMEKLKEHFAGREQEALVDKAIKALSSDSSVCEGCGGK